MDESQRAAIDEMIHHFANIELQRRVWMATEGEVSSPAEMYSMLYDDLYFEPFAGEAFDQGDGFYMRIHGILERYFFDEEEFDPVRMLSDPLWVLTVKEIQQEIERRPRIPQL